MSWNSLQVVRHYTHTPFVVDLDRLPLCSKSWIRTFRAPSPCSFKNNGIGLLHGICMDMEWEDAPGWRTNPFVFIFVLLIELRHGISDVITVCLWKSGAFSTLHLHVLSCSAEAVCCNDDMLLAIRLHVILAICSIEVHTYLALRSSYLWQTF